MKKVLWGRIVYNNYEHFELWPVVQEKNSKVIFFLGGGGGGGEGGGLNLETNLLVRVEFLM